VKPAEDASMAILRMAELAVEAGFPEGVINIVTGGGATGRALVNNLGIDMVAFTGSTTTGAEIAQSCAKSIRPAILELGGKSPVIVMNDANLDWATETAAAAILFNTGQDCTAGSRLLVQEKVFNEVIERVATAMRKIRIAAPLSKQSEMGPLISERQFKRVLGYISSGVTEGAEVVTGGGRHGDAGFYVQPTLFVNPAARAKIVREEIFGPVLVAQRFKDLDEAMELANGTDYGLGASFWSTNPTSIQHAVETIEAGTVWINTHGALDPAIPFGGFKRSGIGRELGEVSLRNYTQTKSVVMRS
jgi:phenylacetaldehyde dehydrogenase